MHSQPLSMLTDETFNKLMNTLGQRQGYIHDRAQKDVWLARARKQFEEYYHLEATNDGQGSDMDEQPSHSNYQPPRVETEPPEPTREAPSMSAGPLQPRERATDANQDPGRSKRQSGRKRRRFSPPSSNDDDEQVDGSEEEHHDAPDAEVDEEGGDSDGSCPTDTDDGRYVCATPGQSRSDLERILKQLLSVENLFNLRSALDQLRMRQIPDAEDLPRLFRVCRGMHTSSKLLDRELAMRLATRRQELSEQIRCMRSRQRSISRRSARSPSSRGRNASLHADDVEAELHDSVVSQFYRPSANRHTLALDRVVQQMFPDIALDDETTFRASKQWQDVRMLVAMGDTIKDPSFQGIRWLWPSNRHLSRLSRQGLQHIKQLLEVDLRHVLSLNLRLTLENVGEVVRDRGQHRLEIQVRPDVDIAHSTQDPSRLCHLMDIVPSDSDNVTPFSPGGGQTTASPTSFQDPIPTSVSAAGQPEGSPAPLDDFATFPPSVPDNATVSASSVVGQVTASSQPSYDHITMMRSPLKDVFRDQVPEDTAHAFTGYHGDRMLMDPELEYGLEQRHPTLSQTRPDSPHLF